MCGNYLAAMDTFIFLYIPLCNYGINILCVGAGGGHGWYGHQLLIISYLPLFVLSFESTICYCYLPTLTSVPITPTLIAACLSTIEYVYLFINLWMLLFIYFVIVKRYPNRGKWLRIKLNWIELIPLATHFKPKIVQKSTIY